MFIKRIFNFMSKSNNKDIDDDISEFENSSSGGNSIDSLSVSKMFSKYARISKKKDEDVENNEFRVSGLMEFCKDLDVKPENPYFLILFEKIKSKEQYIIVKDNFLKGMKKLRLKNLGDVKKSVKVFCDELKDADRFSQVFKYGLIYYGGDEKSVDVDLAILIWDCLLNYEGNALESYATMYYSDWKLFVKKYFSLKDVKEDYWNDTLKIMQLENDIEKGKRKKTIFQSLLKNDFSKSKLFKSYMEYLEKNKKFDE